VKFHQGHCKPKRIYIKESWLLKFKKSVLTEVRYVIFNSIMLADLCTIKKQFNPELGLQNLQNLRHITQNYKTHVKTYLYTSSVL